MNRRINFQKDSSNKQEIIKKKLSFCYEMTVIPWSVWSLVISFFFSLKLLNFHFFFLFSFFLFWSFKVMISFFFQISGTWQLFQRKEFHIMLQLSQRSVFLSLSLLACVLGIVRGVPWVSFKDDSIQDSFLQRFIGFILWFLVCRTAVNTLFSFLFTLCGCAMISSLSSFFQDSRYGMVILLHTAHGPWITSFSLRLLDHGAGVL